MKTPQINFNNFQLEPEALVQSQIAAFESVLRSGWWILGQKVKDFEGAWASACGTQGAVAVANGLDAIEIGLRALGVGRGDEVITTSLTAFATILAIYRCGATPVFADIDPATACLSPTSVKRCITSATRAVLVVHLYGRAADLSTLKDICDQNNLFLLEDCAQAHGAYHNGHSVGSLGVFGAWSFYPTKNLGAIGDAGALTSSDQSVLGNARKLRNYGQQDRYHHDLIGLNSRMDELQAALLLERLQYLSTWTVRRRSIAEYYWESILHPEIILLEPPSPADSHVNHLFVVLTPRRDDLQRHLIAHGVQSLIHYPVPCHRQPSMMDHRIDPHGLSSTEKHCSMCLSLPIHPFLTDEQIEYIASTCNRFPSA